jgi:hypothetical protein
MAARLSALRANPTLPPGFFIFKDPHGQCGRKDWVNLKKFTSSGLEPATFRLAA